MDKRTILFVVVLSLTLFGVNLFFQYQNIQKKEEWLSQQKLNQSKLEKQPQTVPKDGKFNSPILPTVINEAKKQEEQFFVLENAYQQLVFSNYGAALAVINLPFQSESDHSSFVL